MQITNLIVSENLAIKVGISSAVIYDYLLKKSINGRHFLDLDDISENITIMSSRSIGRAIDKLVSEGIVKKIKLTSIDKYEILSNKQMEGLGIGNRVCEWCGCNTTILNKHHFPIQAKDNGTETVNICANCHSEFHHLTYDLVIQEVD